MSTGYPPDWDRRRREVYAEDGYQCQNCGRKGGPHGNTELHAHHIVPHSRGGTHAKSNLVTICKGCHKSVHGDRVAPSTGNTDVERWTELTGSIIDNSKRLVVSVDTHLGRVIDYISETDHEGGYALLDRNPADNDRLWNEKEDLRREFYEIKALVDERKQYENTVTPVTVLNAVAQYIESFETYVKATINIWSFFDDIRTEGRLSELHCPTCSQEIAKESAYCNHCGAEIKFDDHDRDEEIKQLERWWDRLHAEFNKAADDMQIDMVRMDVAMNVASPNETSVGWPYCPNCGFENSVWKDEFRMAICQLCQAKWVKKGILFTKWQMVEGEYEGESLDNDEWVKRGRDKNSNRRYEDLLRVHH